MNRPAATVRLLAWTVERLPAARARIDEAMPGWPTRTVPSGAGGNGGGSVVERTAATFDADPAVVAARRLDAHLATVDRHVRAAADIVSYWSTARRGVEGPDDNDAWCQSCRRVGMAAPAERRGLCGWCRRFQYSEGCLPPVELLDARKAGRRISQAMVAAAVAGRSLQ